MPDSFSTEEIDWGENILDDVAYNVDNEQEAEFVYPALGFAAGKKFMGRKGRREPLPSPAGKRYVQSVVEPRAPATQSQLAGGLSRVGEDFKKVNAAIKTLERRLDLYSGQLAALQQKKTGEQAADLFRYALTSYLSDATSGIMGRDWGQLAIQALPLVQTMLTRRGGVSSSFSTMPWSTALFPLGGILAVWLLRKPKPPVITSINEQIHITADLIPFAKTRYTTDGTEPDAASIEYTVPFRISKVRAFLLFFFGGITIKAKSFNVLGVSGDTTSYTL
jgi:hypothetical protein